MVGRRMRMIREELGLTYVQASKAIGYNSRYWYHVETGRVKPSEEFIRRLCRTFGAPKSFWTTDYQRVYC